MLVLGIDTSSRTGAIGLVNDTGLLGEINIRLSKRHSERLLPNLDYLLQETGYNLKDIDGIGVTSGPGSFTGIRIGLSTVKTIIQVLGIPTIGLSTLELLAFNLVGQNNWLVPVLDARRERVYTALFHGWQKEIRKKRIWPDQALSVSELLSRLEDLDREGTFYIVGDGVSSYQKIFMQSDLNLIPALPIVNLNSGRMVAELARYYLLNGMEDEPGELLPEYLKKPQAEINWQKKYGSGE